MTHISTTEQTDVAGATFDIAGVVRLRDSQGALFGFGNSRIDSSPDPRPALAALDEHGRAARVAVLPTDLPWELAVTVPFVAEVLRVWDALGLELGTAALITEAEPWAPLAALAAGWYGATPLIVGSAGPPDSSSQVGSADDERVIRLRSALAEHPAVCALELTGRAAAVDLVLEAVPRFSRVVFAGAAAEPLTIDFYANVHRKGVLLASTVLSSSRALEAQQSGGTASTLARASRLLERPDRAAACRAALSPFIDVRPSR